MAQFRSKPFGVTKNGDKVDEYIISNPGGLLHDHENESGPVFNPVKH